VITHHREVRPVGCSPGTKYTRKRVEPEDDYLPNRRPPFYFEKKIPAARREIRNAGNFYLETVLNKRSGEDILQCPAAPCSRRKECRRGEGGAGRGRRNKEEEKEEKGKSLSFRAEE